MKKLLAVLSMFVMLASAGFAKAPDIRMLVAQYENTVEFVMPEGGSWKAGQTSSGEIAPNVTYKILGKITLPAERKFHLMVATLDIMDDQGLLDAIEKYQRMHFKTHTIAVGEAPKMIGMPDNRVVHVGIACYNEKEKAEAHKSELAAKGIKTWIYIENIRPAMGNLTFVGNNGGSHTIAGVDWGFTLTPNKTVILKNVEHSKGYSWHGFEDRTYKGKVFIYFGMDDLMDCIEYTNLEEVLIGVVPSEISAKAEKAAMEAQAVAARGEILSKKGLRHVRSGYDFCSEQHCQVYKGRLKNYETISEKIKGTYGKVLMMGNSTKILDAVYSSNCGGHSSAIQNIWVGEANPHLQGVSDEKSPKKRDLTNETSVADYINNPPTSWCGTKGFEGADKYRWTKELTKEDWAKVEEKAAIGRIKSAEIMTRDVSGRICTMKLTGENADKTLMSELEIRQLFGGLRSSCFIVEFEANKEGYISAAKFKGAGFGHGVGMCQTGAQAMAAAGYSYELILEHYFPKARLIPLYY